MKAAWARILLVAAAAWLPGCDLKDAEDEFILSFRNPEVAGNLDSLIVYGINRPAGDTLLILRWTEGQPFPEEAPYPRGLGRDFDLVALGFREGEIIRRTRTAVTAGQAGPLAYERLLVPPELADSLVELPRRIDDSMVLAPLWKQVPGWKEEVFRPEGTHAWMKEGRVLARDTLLSLPSLAWSDSGTYVFVSENRAGRDSMAVRISLRHRFPGIPVLADRAALAGQPLSIRAQALHSDSVRYRWLKGNVEVSDDSVLAFPRIEASHAGAYRLEMRNATDTTESAVSNTFRIVLVGRLSKWDALKWNGDVWW